MPTRRLYPDPSVVLTVRLDAHTVAALDALAEAHGQTRSRFVRSGLEALAERATPVTASNVTASTVPSAPPEPSKPAKRPIEKLPDGVTVASALRTGRCTHPNEVKDLAHLVHGLPTRHCADCGAQTWP